jgi:hypothetical protein
MWVCARAGHAAQWCCRSAAHSSHASTAAESALAALRQLAQGPCLAQLGWRPPKNLTAATAPGAG